MRSIIVVSSMVVALVVLHFFVFAPLSSAWTRTNREFEEKVQRVENVIGKGIRTLDAPVIKRETDKVLVRQNVALSELEQVYSFEGQINPEPGINYREEIIKTLHDLKQFEESIEKTEMNLLASWGIGDGLTTGRFDKGLKADEDNSYAYLLRSNLVQKGTLEFFVKPLWNPKEEAGHHVFASLVGLKPTDSVSAQGPEMATLNVVKDSKGQIMVRLTSYDGAVETIPYDIMGWEPETWHHLAVTWDQSSGDVTFYVDGRFAGKTGEVAARGTTRTGRTDMGMMGMETDMMMMEMGMSAPRTRSSRSRGNSEGAVILNTIEGLDFLYVGVDKDGANPADAIIDELRVSTTVRNDFRLDRVLQADDSTLLLRHFDEEFVPPDSVELTQLLKDMTEYLKQSSDERYGEAVRQRLEMQYQVLRKSLGINVDRIEEFSPDVAPLEELFLADFLRTHAPSFSTNLDVITDLLKFNLPNRRGLFALYTFLDLARIVAQKSVDSNIISVDELTYLGESTDVSEEALYKAFNQTIAALEEKYPPEKRGMGGMGMGMGMEEMMFMEGGMGGMPYMGGMMGGAGGNPEEMMQTMQDLEKLKRYKEAQEVGEIPADYKREYRAQQEKGGSSIYRKRMVQIQFTSTVEQMSRLLHSLEYGERFATVNRLLVDSDENNSLHCSTKIDFHFFEPAEIEIASENVEGATGPAVAETAQS